MNAALIKQSLNFAIIVGSLSSVCACHRSSDVAVPADKSSTPEAIIVGVKSVELRKIGRTVNARGRCEALPHNQAVLTPIIEGRVSQLLAKVGDEVAADRPIIQLDTTLARADLAEKKSVRDSLVASLDALQSKPRSEEQRAAKIAIEQGDVAVQRAEGQLDRLRPLRERNEIPEVQIYEAEESVKQARLQREAAQAQLDSLMLSPRPELIAEAKSKIKVADEAVNTAIARVTLHTIKAPISGVLTRVNCRNGQTVSTGSEVAEITDSRQVLVVCWMSTKWRGVLAAGTMAQIQLRLPPSELKRDNDSLLSVNGQIILIGKNADAQTGNIPVHVLVDNKDGKLLIGQTLTVMFVLEGFAKSTCVPVVAVQDEGEGASVRVVRDGKSRVLHPTLGASDHEWVSISNTDLQPGDLVVVSGGYNLPDGTSVQVTAGDEAAQAASDSSTRNPTE